MAETHLWVVVALVCCRVGTQEVKVALIVNIPDVDALGFVQDHWDRCIVVRTILVFSCYELQQHVLSCHSSWGTAMQCFGGRIGALRVLTLCCTEEEA